MATRLELIESDPDYTIWIGEGTKNGNNQGIFSISPTGDAYFDGAIASAYNLRAAQSPSLSTAANITVGSAAGVKQIVSSLNYKNSGTSTTNLTKTISANLVLSKGSTDVAGAAAEGSIVSVQHGSTYYTSINLSTSFTFTDTAIPAATYSLRITSPSPGWPVVLTGGPSSGHGIMRLGLVITSTG